MPSRKILGLLLSSSLVFLAGCLGALPKSSTGQEYESNQKLLEVYSQVTGVFEGYLSDNPNSEPNIPVRLEIFIAHEAAGRNEDGETKFVPVLQAVYRRLDVDDVRWRYFIRAVRYYQESGEVLMVVDEKAQSGVPGVGYLSVQGRLKEGTFVGSLTDHRGPQGVLRLERLASLNTEQ
jgi:hypothetical protein